MEEGAKRALKEAMKQALSDGETLLVKKLAENPETSKALEEAEEGSDYFPSPINTKFVMADATAKMKNSSNSPVSKAKVTLSPRQQGEVPTTLSDQLSRMATEGTHHFLANLLIDSPNRHEKTPIDLSNEKHERISKSDVPSLLPLLLTPAGLPCNHT